MTDKPSPPSDPVEETTAAGASATQLQEQLLMAAYYGDIEKASQAIALGANVSATDPVTGLAPIHLAIAHNDLPLLTELVENWDAPVVPDASGRSPTILACRCDASAELIEYVAEKEDQSEQSG